MTNEKIEQAVKIILKEIGEDTEREGLLETPKRVTQMLSEITSGLHTEPSDDLSKTFTVDNNNMVIVKDIYFYSMCEHHLLPFFGTVSIGYIPSSNEVLGLSKLARLVESISKKPQLQERITEDIAFYLEKAIMCEGVVVLVKAEHLCMSMRGIKKPGAQTVTSEVTGCFKEQNNKLQEFFNMIS